MILFHLKMIFFSLKDDFISLKDDFISLKDGGFNFTIGKYAYKLEITLIDGAAFMLQFEYDRWSFATGKCAYKF